ncbi:hypothetical protein PGTUg99_001473 [Puccinia graminis f. sp. tritici]|uniref:Proteasome assembly chaperone 4 n=2 Tax=Puccinia graminis f. sp. tritici TaxID=56615 RepID=E3KU53_PUCGT|nr:uncharacterized protein PGTG_14543 [Puccinia graminis f. sp. tritici CRL 75-36-700-3]EFP87828.1 hypothetical protein PGTG_14543 [Puccinia graminis f. sp. tritici CRL 75-36-700-3]KAA1070901.1 hypothetical protein PGTUg99_010639 [Puccinia graminis f. sp. tritici]KAA1112350.1 hypothetical protein PGTUg99_001473 [Puccinia graminis f. sp. tritici]
MAEHATSATAAEMKISVCAYQTTLTIPDRPSLPDFLFHFTRLTQSMMIWIGTVSNSSDHSAGHCAVDTCLAKDWSCAVPPSTSFPAISTRLNSSNPTDGFSQALAQKIAQKFRIQAFVSIDLPASLLGSDSQIKFALEKQLFGHIQSLLSTKTSQEPKEKTC